MAIPPFNPSSPGAPGNPNDRKKTGTGFTNLNRIMSASQGNRLGQAVGGGVSQQADQARTGLNQARTGFNQQSEDQRLDSDANKQAVDTGINRAEQGEVIDDKTAQDFSRFRAGRYDGPQKMENEDQVINRAQQAQNLGGLAGSSGGRQALLQRFVGGAGYSQGKQRLDNLILGQSGAQDLRNARRDTQGLAQTAQTAADAARQQGQYLANQAKQFGTDLTNRLTDRDAANIASVDTDVAYVTDQEKARSALYDQIKNNLAADGFRESAGHNGGDAKNTNIDKVNQAMALAQANNIAQGNDMDMVKKLYGNLMTPMELLYRQKVEKEGDGLLGYGAGNSSGTGTSSGGNIYSNLGINEVLHNAFKTQGYENLDRQGVASDLQRAKAAALAKLAEKQSVFSDTDKRFKASSAAFDMNQASGDVDKEIARLKGESVVDLPTIYQDTPLEKKLARTFAPTANQLGDDVTADAKNLLSSDASLGSRAGSAAKLAYSPLRGALGQTLETGKLVKDQTQESLNDIFSGKDITGGVAGMATLPGQLVSQKLGGVSDLLGKVPVIGNLLSKPAALASSVTGKAASLAQSGASKVGKAIKSIFCYAAGTPIKLKNGKFKAVDKLELGDELFYGGKVTATGKALEDDIYEYMGTKVTGGHAVFEGGKFVRVQDSKFGKKLDEKDVEVFPIECENHILVTKTHLGADYSETDDGHTISPEERLEKLNSDKTRIKKLDTASALIFKGNNED